MLTIYGLYSAKEGLITVAMKYPITSENIWEDGTLASVTEGLGRAWAQRRAAKTENGRGEEYTELNRVDSWATGD